MCFRYDGSNALLVCAGRSCSRAFLSQSRDVGTGSSQSFGCRRGCRNDGLSVMGKESTYPKSKWSISLVSLLMGC